MTAASWAKRREHMEIYHEIAGFSDETEVSTVVVKKRVKEAVVVTRMDPYRRRRLMSVHTKLQGIVAGGLVGELMRRASTQWSGASGQEVVVSNQYVSRSRCSAICYQQRSVSSQQSVVSSQHASLQSVFNDPVLSKSIQQHSSQQQGFTDG